MTLTETIQQFNTIFIDILDNDDIHLEEDTIAEDVEEWDSLTNIQLIVAIEKHFNIRFTADEIDSYKNVGEMCQGVISKL